MAETLSEKAKLAASPNASVRDVTFCHDVCSIVVTYRPDQEQIFSLASSLMRQSALIIVDNNSPGITELKTAIEIIADNIQGSILHIIKLKTNTGLGSAINRGIEYVQLNMPEIHYISLFDQDSLPEANYTKSIRDVFRELERSDQRVGALGPTLIDSRDGHEYGFHTISGFIWKARKCKFFESDVFKIDSLNGSGTFTSLSTIRQVGMLDEDFFIDHIDTEWSFRANSRKRQLFGTSRVRLSHTMGGRVVDFWMFGNRKMPHRSPERHYTIFRNSLLLQKTAYVPIVWKFWNLVKLVFTFSYFGLFDAESTAHRRHMVRGVLAGLKQTRRRKADLVETTNAD